MCFGCFCYVRKENFSFRRYSFLESPIIYSVALSLVSFRSVERGCPQFFVIMLMLLILYLRIFLSFISYFTIICKYEQLTSDSLQFLTISFAGVASMSILSTSTNLYVWAYEESLVPVLVANVHVFVVVNCQNCFWTSD